MRTPAAAGLPALAALTVFALLLSAPTCAGDDPATGDPGPDTAAPPSTADDPPPPSAPTDDPCAVCVLGRELTPEEQEICARCNQPPAELAPAVATDPCSVCIEGRALNPQEQELCARCGGP